MRFIRTQNNYVEFIEADNNDNILSARGFQFGELYFRIENKKVTFYLNDQENPWRNDVWTINIPFLIDGTLVENEDDASAILHNIMNDRFQEQLDELRSDLDEEIGRSIATDEALGKEIDDERDRAISAETYLQNQVTQVSATVETFDYRITHCEEAVSAMQEDLHDEIVRSTAKDTEHDALISGLTNDLEDLDDKVDEAISAHTMIVQKLDDEISRAYSAETLINQALANEVARAVSAETRIEIKLDNEIQERKDADIVLSGAIDSLSAYCEDTYAKKEDLEALEDKVDQAMSSITDDLQAEIARATAREDDIAEDLDNEFHRAQSAEHLLEDKIVTERERALGAEEELREMIQTLELSGVTEDEMKDYVSGYTYSKAESDAKYQPKLTAGENISIVDNVISAKDTTYSAGTNVQINGNVISATDTKYSAGTNVQISGNVISAKDTTYSAGSGISISDTNVISVTGGSEPVDAYTKAESDAKFATINNFNSHSGNTTVHITSAERTKWNNKADIWSGTEAQWAQISGGTLDNNTIYLVY